MADDDSAPLTSAGVDFSNVTQASDFLGQLLDDSTFQIDGNATARRFWYGIVVVIGVATICNFIWRLLLWTRLRAAHKNNSHPTRPRSSFINTIIIFSRRLWYPQLTPTTKPSWIKVPPLGSIYIVLAYYIFIIVLEFVDLNTPAIQYWTFLGIRAGWLAMAQIPLIVLLVGKKNLIGFLSGVSYERLNVFHRWVARGLLLLATFHFAFLSTSWDRYGLTQLEWSTDTAPPTGIAAYAILLWMNLSTIAPLRHLSYEFFFIQHVLTFFGFAIALAYHVPGSAKYARVWVYIFSALYLVERLVQAAFFLWNNIRPGYVSLEQLDGRATRLRVSTQQIKNWTPGTHVLLMIPRFGFLQSHPATIMSTPTSHGGDMVFILRAYGGITKRLLKNAVPKLSSGSKNSNSLATVEESKEISELGGASADHHPKYWVLLNGPYGSSHADFACFDSVLLIAGATGVTFTMAVLLDLAERVSSSRSSDAENSKCAILPVRSINFVWIIRGRSWVSWVAKELQYVEGKLASAGISFLAEVYITKEEKKKTSGAAGEKEGSKAYSDSSQAITVTNSPATASIDESERKSKENIGAMAVGNQNQGFVLRSGRPTLETAFEYSFGSAEGECAVGVCGPLGLSTDVRKKVVDFNGKRRDFGVYLHVESFS